MSAMIEQADIRLVTGRDDLMAVTPVLLQLRPQYAADSLVARIEKQQASDGYQVACLFLDNEPACVAGFVINEKLAWGRCLYVDDLVTAEAARSRGAGKAMIAWLKAYAREAGCDQLHLDSGVQRKDAHRFYDREGFARSSLHFQITDLTPE